MLNVEKRYKFDGRCYNGWAEKMKFLFISVDVFYVLDPNLSPIPEDPVGKNADEKVIADLEKQRMLRKEDEAFCYKYIISSLSDRLYDLYTLRSNNDPRLLWKALENDFKAMEYVPNKLLVDGFLDFRMVDGKPIMEQAQMLHASLNSLKNDSINVPDVFYIAALLTKLPPSWKDFADRMMIDNLSLDELFKQIRIEERARNSKDKQSINGPRGVENTKTPPGDHGRPSGTRQLGVKKRPNNFKKTTPHCNVPSINAAQLADLMAHTNLISGG